MSIKLSQLEALLTSALAPVVDDFQAVTDVRQLTAGASKLTFRVEVATSSGTAVYACRCDSSESGKAASEAELAPQLTMKAEAAVLGLASSNGVKVPEIVAVLPMGESLQGFIMEWLDGESLGHKIVYDEGFAGARKSLASQCGESLAKIHSLDCEHLKEASSLTVVMPSELVDSTFQLYADLKLSIPIIDYVWIWLRDNLPSDSKTTLVHGDFRNGNLLVDDNGLVAVLDWELAHIGDPIRDLGWLCVNSWRFGKSECPVGGFGQIEDLLAAYERHSGQVVDSQDLHFWQVFGSFWWAITTLLMANTWRTGENTSLERPVIGRRSSEAQIDCANLLFPGNVDIQLDVNSQAETQLPSSVELMQGVKQFLESDLSQKLDSHDRFMAKVAANSLGILEREIRHGEQFALQEKGRLAQLLSHQGSLLELRDELVVRIRAGHQLDTEMLCSHLRLTAAAQVTIDQPKYSGLRASVN